MLRALDLAVLRLLRTRGHAPPIELAVLRFTHLGEHGNVWYAVAVAGMVVDAPRRTTYLRAARTVLITYLANIGVKFLIRRARPLLEDLPALSPTLTDLSYPSAHSSTSFAAARVLSEVLPRAPLYACATAMALSRPYLGLHYPSDSLAGAGLGMAMADLLP
jgi:membrane-associated phospholipid phosphatase